MAGMTTPLVVAGDPVLGVFLGGEPNRAWVKGHWATIPEGTAHLVAIGATGAGKTNSILRLAAAHLEMGWRVIVIDAKEDLTTGREFAGMAASSGIHPSRIRVWPDDGPIDLLRGSPHAIRDRLMASAAWTEPYYRAVAGTILTLACEDPSGPPHRFADLLARIDTATLRARWAGSERAAIAAGITAPDTQGVRFRYFTIAADLESCGATSMTGGGWAWEDADASWVTLPTSTRPETAATFGRALLVDLISYLRDGHRRPLPHRPILLVVEELGAIVSADPSTANLVLEATERARSAHVRTVLSVQTVEGLGNPDAQARILHGGAAVLAHRMPAPEAIVELVGTRYGLEASLGIDRSGMLLDRGSVREQHQFRVPPDRLRELPVGQAIFIESGRWMHVAVPRQAVGSAGR